MARPLRIDQEDTFYHVLNRGNERRAIFRDPRDYEGFLDRLGRCSQRFSLEVYAYVLMGNHYHLLVKTHEANLLAAMQWRQGRLGLAAIGEPFGVKGSAASQTCRRAERHLQTNPKLRRQLKGLLE